MNHGGEAGSGVITQSYLPYLDNHGQIGTSFYKIILLKVFYV